MSSDLKISQMTFSGARPVNNDIPWVGGTPIDNYRSTLQDITGMYSNFTAGDRALAGVPTAGWAAAGGVYFVVNGGAIYPYLARAGTDAQSVPNIIRPTDYAGGTNELVFDLLTFYTDGVIVGNGSITDTTPGLVVAAGGSGNRNIFLTPTGAAGNVTVGTSGILVLDNGASQATFSAAGTAVWTGAASLTPGAGTNLNISLTSTALASVTNSSGATMRLSNTGTTAVSQYELYSSATSFGSLAYAPAGGANDGLIIRDGRTDAQAKITFQLQSAEVARLVAGNLLLGTTTNTAGSGNLVVAGGTVTAGAAATSLTLSGGSSGASLVLGSGASAGASLAVRAGGRLNLTAAASNDAYVEYVGNAGTAGTTSVVVGQSGVGLGVIYNRGNYALTFGTNSLERGRFTETGNLLIGTTTDMASTAGGLTVAATGSGATATAVNTGGLRSANFGLSTVSGGASYFGGAVSIASTTPSTGIGTGALQVAGGVYAGAASVFGSTATFAGATLTLAPSSAEATITSKGRASGTNPLATTSRGGTLTLTNLDTTDNNAEAISFHNSNDLAIASIVAQNVSHTGRTGKLYFNVSNGAAPVEALSIASTGAATFAGAVTSPTIAHTPAAAPSSPASGWIIYVDSGDGNKLKAKASTGTVITLATP